MLNENFADESVSANRGLFVVINLRAFDDQNFLSNSNILSNDVENLRNLANHLRCEFYAYSPKEAFTSASRKRFTTNYLLEVSTYIFDKIQEGKHFSCLITVVIANSEHARSNIPLYFFDNSTSRMDLYINELIESFTRNNLPCFRRKPKVFIIYAPEKVRAQVSEIINPGYVEFPIILPEEEEFFLCISRPYEKAASISEANRQSHFISQLCSIITDADFGINIFQVMIMLQNETDQHSETRIREEGLEGRFVPAPLRYVNSLTGVLTFNN